MVRRLVYPAVEQRLAVGRVAFCFLVRLSPLFPRTSGPSVSHDLRSRVIHLGVAPVLAHLIHHGLRPWVCLRKEKSYDGNIGGEQSNGH